MSGADPSNTSSLAVTNFPAFRYLDTKQQHFKVLHQKLCLEINLDEQSITGYTDLFILPQNERKFDSFYLNCLPPIKIHSVTIDGIPCEQPAFNQPPGAFPRPGVKNPTLNLEHVRDVESFELQMMESIDSYERGEVKIFVPLQKQKITKIKVENPVQNEQKMDTGEEQKDSSDAAASAAAASSSSSLEVAEPVVLRISYSVRASDTGGAGIHFLKPTPYARTRAPQLFTSSGLTSGIEPSLWFPCADQWEERCTWELDLIAAKEYAVVASGNLVSKQLLSGSSGSTSEKVLWKFKIDVPVTPRSIGITCAPFVSDSITDNSLLKKASENGEESTGGTTNTHSSSRNREPTIEIYAVPGLPSGVSSRGGAAAAAANASSSSNSAAAAAAEDAHMLDADALTKQAERTTLLSLLRYSFAKHLPSMFSMYENLFGSAYPFGEFKLIAMEEVHGKFNVQAVNYYVIDREILFDPSMIDPVYTTLIQVSYGVALNWISHSLQLESPADWWIVQGIAGWASHMFCMSLFGVNDMKYRTLLDSTFVLDEDGEQGSCYRKPFELSESEVLAGCTGPVRRLFDSHPLYWPGSLFFTELENSLFRAKAHIVFRMLDARIGGSAAAAGGAGSTASAGGATGNGLKNLVLRLMEEFSSCNINESLDTSDESFGSNKLNTLSLLGICIDLAGEASGVASLRQQQIGSIGTNEILLAEHGEPLRLFFEQWIFCTGYPSIKVNFEYSAKRKESVVTIEQGAEGFPKGVTEGGALIRFNGAMRFRIHEVDRVNDQERPLSTSALTGASAIPGSQFREAGNKIEYDFVCSSKVKRNRKRKKMDEESLNRLPLDKLLVRHNDTPILYCRVDPLLSWFGPMRAHQAAMNVLWKALQEREVIGQYDGINAVMDAWRIHLDEGGHGRGDIDVSEREARDLEGGGAIDEKLPDDIYAKMLGQTFSEEKFYVHIRLLAAKHLAESANKGVKNCGAHLVYIRSLIARFKEKFVYVSKQDADLARAAAASSNGMDDTNPHASILLRSNDFTNISEYFLKKGLPLILSRVRHLNEHESTKLFGTTPPEVISFILDLLRDNDNSDNPYTDVFYLGTLLECLGNFNLIADPRKDKWNDHLFFNKIEPIKNELLRFLNYDQVVPSYQFHLSQQALLALAKLERSGQVSTADEYNTPSSIMYNLTASQSQSKPKAASSASSAEQEEEQQKKKEASKVTLIYEQFVTPVHKRAVRIAAFKALVMVLPVYMTTTPTYPHILPWRVLDIVDNEPAPGVQAEMLMHFAKQVTHGIVSARLFRDHNEHGINQEFQNRLWKLMNTTLDSRSQAAAYRLYRAIYGMSIAPCTGTTEKRSLKKFHEYMHQLQRRQEVRSGEKTWSRIEAAKEYLHLIREPRQFTEAETAAATRTATTKATKTFKLVMKADGTHDKVAVVGPEDITLDY